jgi:HNH endonuclease
MRTAKRVVPNPLDRFAPNPSGCWIWTGPVSTTGYGIVQIGSRIDKTRQKLYAHRLFYEAFKGPIEQKLQIDHLCKRRLCVNPDHLEAVTPSTNIRRSKRPQCPKGHKDFRIQRNGVRRCNVCYPIHGIANSLKTHCPRGHLYDVLKKDGSRSCSICHAKQERERQFRKK